MVHMSRRILKSTLSPVIMVQVTSIVFQVIRRMSCALRCHCNILAPNDSPPGFVLRAHSRQTSCLTLRRRHGSAWNRRNFPRFTPCFILYYKLLLVLVAMAVSQNQPTQTRHSFYGTIRLARLVLDFRQRLKSKVKIRHASSGKFGSEIRNFKARAYEDFDQ